jgi:hypothetical protein
LRARGPQGGQGGQVEYVVFEEGIDQPLLLALPMPPDYAGIFGK